MLAEDELVCPTCGYLRSECSDDDPDIAWYPQKVICYATAVREAQMRRLFKKFENAKPNAAGLLPLDGVSVWVARDNLQPDEKIFD